MAVKATGTGPSTLRTFTFPDADTGFLTTTSAVLPYVIGDLLYASSTTAVSKLAGVAVGQVLVSGGAGVAPAWSAGPSLTNVTLPATTSAVTGILFKGAQRFLHNYADGTALGINTFLGLEAGNFTMGPGGGASYLGSYNTGIGFSSLKALTTGFNNTGCGENTLLATTTGQENTAVGAGAMISNIGGQDNVAVGIAALYLNTSGTYNVAVGAYAGYIDGTKANVSGNFNTWVGWNTGSSSAAQREGAIAIGYNAQSTADYQAMLGDATITTTVLRGAVSGPTALAVSSFLATGAVPAASGPVRLTNNEYARSRNAANGADRVLIGLGSDDVVYIQDKPGGAVAPYEATVDLGLTTWPWRSAYLAGYLEGVEMTPPAAPAANKGRLYFDDSGGKTRLMVIFNTGAAQQVAIQP